MVNKKTIRRTVNKTARHITKAVGGADLAEYAGAKIAKARAPKSQKKYIKSKATGRQAASSAAAVALTVGVGAAGGAVGSSYKATKAAVAAKKARTISKKIKVAGQSKKMKVNNWSNATQIPRRTRKPRLHIKRK